MTTVLGLIGIAVFVAAVVALAALVTLLVVKITPTDDPAAKKPGASA